MRQLTNDDGTSFVVSGSMSNNILIFNVLTRIDNMTSPDVPRALFEGNVSPYWDGDFTIYADSAEPTSTEQVVSWSRSGGAEDYRLDFPKGDFFHVVGNADCSGTISSKDTADNGAVTTVSGS